MIQSNKPSLDLIFRQALTYWKNTLVYQLLFSLIFISVLFSVVYYAANQFGIYDQYISILQKNSGDMTALQKDIQDLTKSSNYISFSWVMIATMVFLFPLNIGFFKLYKKMDLNEEIRFQDFFSGYSGINFFIYISYYLFWFMVYSYTMPTIIFGILWVMITLFTTPLMFFDNKKIFETLSLNFQAMKQHFLVIFVGVISAFFIKYSGFLIFGFGILFTYPFFNAMIYALYKNIFVESKTSSQTQS
ncbi:hypothetical protein [Amniculibacterium aquaticum]|uniref:hypothetical protein n=1 Tax=Amniculibacterium aquaticum TaxID=2479858 RepID=UPI000F5B458D|nr:hypothetical protein [Amniculibacterium aquaticum]